MMLVYFFQVIPNLTTTKKNRVVDLQRKLAEHESSKLQQQQSNDLSSLNIPKHLDIKVRLKPHRVSY